MILDNAPKDAEILDLGAARAARAEARGDVSKFLKLSAGYVEVRAEFPIDVAFKLKEEDFRGALADIVSDSADVDALLEDGLSGEDLQEIARFIAGTSLGE